MIGKAAAWRTRLGDGQIYRSILHWRQLARWLDQRELTLADCTEEVWRAYSLHLVARPNPNRNTVGKQLASLTRLWTFDAYGGLPIGIAEPPWNREGVDDFLPAASAGGENVTDPVSPATIGPLLIWALRMVDGFADDILAAWNEGQSITTRAISAVQSTPDGRKRLRAYLDDLAANDRPIPSRIMNGRPSIANGYIVHLTGASRSQLTLELRDPRWKEHLRRNPGGCPLTTTITGRVDGKPWTPAIDLSETSTLMRHLGTAAFIVLSYLTGMRPSEVLALRSGCCPNPQDTGQRHLIRGHTFKNARGEDGNHLPGGELREVPWVAIAPVVSAVRVLERMVPEGELLFNSSIHDYPRNKPGRQALSFETLSTRIEDFAKWASGLAQSMSRSYEIVPDDPRGAIAPARFRRTLAWHIARRPGGLVALAVQYGHLRTTVSVGYAARSRDGIHDLLDIETARASADTLAQLHADRAAGIGISGPAARRAIHAAANAPAFPGLIITARQARALLHNPTLAVHDNPDAYLTCVYNPAKALCHQQKPADTPSLNRCVATCSNIARTDHHAASLTAKAAELERQAGTQLIPGPLADRLRATADRLRALADQHRRERTTAEEAPDDTSRR
ncbi:integrase [Kitasatospora sp. NPDC005856]|uniref:integrase n=1 Tax=Kitasatospora sp. NPDC005856 TaxID=3154566 RepID=UPI0033FC5D97